VLGSRRWLRMAACAGAKMNFLTELIERGPKWCLSCEFADRVSYTAALVRKWAMSIVATNYNIWNHILPRGSGSAGFGWRRQRISGVCALLRVEIMDLRMYTGASSMQIFFWVPPGIQWRRQNQYKKFRSSISNCDPQSKRPGSQVEQISVLRSHFSKSYITLPCCLQFKQAWNSFQSEKSLQGKRSIE
jgi:hypothetical protein